MGGTQNKNCPRWGRGLGGLEPSLKSEAKRASWRERCKKAP